MDSRPIKVLLIEDNPGDALLIRTVLADSAAMRFDLDWTDDLQKGIQHLTEASPDVVLLDLGLPMSEGLGSLKKVLTCLPAVPPVIVLSGMSNEDLALKAVQWGAQDYLIKGQVDGAMVVRAIRYAIERSQARLALEEARDELEQRVAERTSQLANTVAALQTEVDERRIAEERIRRMVHYDALTGLPNRVLLQDRVQQAINHAHRTGNAVAVLFIDLDYFKHINDSLGHMVGDSLLKMAASRLAYCLRENDSVARLGGDEFVLCLPDLADSADAAHVAQKALDALSQPYPIEGHQLHISASIGISVYPQDGSDVESLMRTADTAMYHAKETGRNNFQYFTPSLNLAVQQRLMVGNQLRQALAQREFVLYYQPQVDMQDESIFSAEALLRWRQHDGTAVSCGSFIASAEESGLIVPIGEWILRQACEQLKAWRDAGHPAMIIAVNLSPRQLEQPEFSTLVERILEEHGLPGDALELEITEGTLMRRSDFNMATLARLCKMGVRLSVDDFGTGYSSLSYLQRFPVHALKIDQSFVKDIGIDARDSALITAIIAMATSLHLDVIAEGVETPEQSQFLVSRGCRAAQGYYYSKALPPDLFIKVMEKWNEAAQQERAGTGSLAIQPGALS